ncbi:MAG: response regulator transcription factor [Flavisolibacter sp.]|nr:response regulator transcription factor [Flavisolibacter sp.]
MDPLKIIIADDEKEARALLLHYLQGWQNTVIKECADGSSTLAILPEFEPDILFLDIKMPELTGLQVVQKRPAALLPAVIFTTAFDEYALPAFDYEAIDYLLKPFEKERFDRAMKRAIDYITFVKNKQARNYLTQLPVKTGSKTELIPVDDIYYFQAEGSYVQAITEKKAYLISDPIYELESALDPLRFARVHRSVIVQVPFIKSIQSLLNGDHILVLSNGKEIRASRTYRDKINELKGKR